MTPEQARKEAVKGVVGGLAINTDNDWRGLVVSQTAYGFVLRIGGHNIRFSAQAEESKHPRKRKAPC